MLNEFLWIDCFLILELINKVSEGKLISLDIWSINFFMDIWVRLIKMIEIIMEKNVWI